MVARNASLALTALLRQVLTLLFHRVANRVANFVASGVASRVTTILLTVLPTKNLLLWWRYWLVGAASEPLWLRVAGERRWPAL
jgi:hypothetical protein